MVARGCAMKWRSAATGAELGIPSRNGVPVRVWVLASHDGAMPAPSLRTSDHDPQPSRPSAHSTVTVGDVDRFPYAATLSRASTSCSHISSSTSSRQIASALTKLADDRFHFATDRRHFVLARNQSVITRSQIASAWRARHTARCQSTTPRISFVTTRR